MLRLVGEEQILEVYRLVASMEEEVRMIKFTWI
jgi:hypothetical protein